MSTDSISVITSVDRPPQDGIGETGRTMVRDPADSLLLDADIFIRRSDSTAE
ncbi:hypothetical protein [Nocardia gipuzkoensis]